MSSAPEWTPRSLKDLRSLDPQVRLRVISALERLAATGAGDVVRLVGVDPPEWRLRVGDWRVRFQIRAPSGVLVLRVLPRDKAY